MGQPPHEKQMVWGCCMCYSFVCFAVALAFSMVLGLGISDDYGGEREPSYDEAARLAGYYDSNGAYQGGQPKWRDWSEDSYYCQQASQNDKYCQAWTTDRYYSDPEQEFLKGNCTCIRPLDASVESTFDAWYNLYEDSQTTSSSEAALQDADFCSAWNCQETRYTQECTCVDYETRTTCRRRQLRTNRGGSSNSCSTREVCVAYSCVYLESNFYTACDCDGNGERRAEWGPDWWREYTHCEEFTCLYGYNLVTMNESFALASSATESASLPVENASVVPINPTVVTGELQGIWAMDYTCTQGVQGNGSVWCDEWSGMTPYQPYENNEVVEQLCGCTGQDAGNSGDYCENWTCTTYYMDTCVVCMLQPVGVIIAGVILMCLAPLCSTMARGHIAQPIVAAPFGIGAAALVAFYFGGWSNIKIGVIPAFVVAIVVGGCAGRCCPTRVDPQPAGDEVKSLQDPRYASTPHQTPIPAAGLAPLSPQAYQQAGFTPVPAAQPGFPTGVTAGGYSYTPPGGQQQSMMQYSPPASPGGFNPPASYGGGGNQGAYGGGLQTGVPYGPPPPTNPYGYQSPPQFKTGVGGGPGGY